MQPVRIGRYEVHTLLGQGGMGAVYKGRDPMMDRWVAIKTLTLQDSLQQARFQQEIRAAGSLNHPHIITTYDVGTDGELAYIVMELVEGSTLAAKLVAPVPWEEAVRLLLPVCQALAYAHLKGVVHRDVKPANILLSHHSQIKLTDFGLARLESTLRRITESGSTVGTPLYTAPEQLRNEPVDGRADLFSLGIVLTELITGTHPFLGDTLAQVVYKITQPDAANLKPLAALSPPNLVEVVSRALQKNPSDRFPNATEMAAALAECVGDTMVLANEFLPQLAKTPQPAAEPAAPRRVLDYVASDLALSPAEEGLLLTAFQRHDRVFLEREFSSGYSSARVLLATPVRSGRRLAKMVLKIDSRRQIEQEWRAYQEFVSETLPPVTARILEQPIYTDDDNNLGLLQYSFAGGLGNMPPESLRAYYARHSGEQVAHLLEQGIFKTFGAKWWLQRRSTDLVLRREYARLLPVNLLLETRDFAELTLTPHTLVAGQATPASCRHLKPGQVVQLQGFKLEERQPDRNEITVRAASPGGQHANSMRVRMVEATLERFFGVEVGQTIPTLLGVVVSTRHHLLIDLATQALPGVDFSQEYFSLNEQPWPNPLHDVESLLDQRVSAMSSIVHGDLNLENVLVTPASDLAWLIDFATTGEGHNLYDFARLETQVITKLLPDVKPEDIDQMMLALHHLDAAGPVPAELRKPFTVIAAIRRMVRICLYSRENMDEYYLGLIVTLLGALKFKELHTHERRAALIAAATLRGLVSNPPLAALPPPPAQSLASPPKPKAKMALVAVVAAGLLLFLGGLGWPGFMRMSAPVTPSPAVTAAVIVDLLPSDTPLPTFTPAPTASSTVPVQGPGLTQAPLKIYSGPGLNYPALTPVPEDTVVQVTGRSADGKWWQIAYPDGSGSFGWLLAEFVTLRDVFVPPVVTPLPPPDHTATPTVTPVAESTATSTTASESLGCEAEPFYATTANRFLDLGCAIERWASDFTFQQFENGLMVWRKSPDPAQIYVFYNNGDWRSLDDPKGPAAASCPEARQNGGLGPILSFGLVWCEGEINRLGQPLTREQAEEDSTVEQFEHGLVFELDGARYVLHDDAWTWDEDQPSEPTPTATATPATCPHVPAPEFEALWHSARSMLGCATGFSRALSFLVEETFEGGRLFWREDTDEVYVIYDRQKNGDILATGNWAAPPWKWDSVSGCGAQYLPPPGMQLPVRGFGWLWCTHLGGPTGPLGWALDKEEGFADVGRSQPFEQGFAIQDSKGKTYALLNDGTFLTAGAAPIVIPTPTPASAPTAALIFVDTGFRPNAVFENTWNNLKGGSGPLGYPTGAAITDNNYAQQYFERGFMFWWDAPQPPQPIWVIYTPNPAETEGDTWRRYDNRWVTGQPSFPPACPDAAQPFGPKSGFGVTWCYEQDVSSQLGRPVQEEFGSAGVNPRGAVQFFQGGVMFENPADQQIWVLVNNGGWYRFGK